MLNPLLVFVTDLLQADKHYFFQTAPLFSPFDSRRCVPSSARLRPTNTSVPKSSWTLWLIS